MPFRRFAQMGMAAFLFGALFATAPLRADSLRVNPIRLKLAPDQRITAVTLSNLTDRRKSVKARVLRWTQVDGADVYTPTDDAIVSPPIFSVPPKGEQIVRVAMRRQTPGTAYRLMIEQIPDEDVQQTTGVDVRLNLNLPLYLLPKGKAEPQLGWAGWRNPDGTITVQARNTGNAHAQISQIRGVTADGQPDGAAIQMGVVLPQSARSWTLTGARSVPATVAFTTAGRNVSSDVARLQP